MRYLRLIMFTLLVASGLAGGDFIVIANAEVKEDAVSAAELKSIYLGKRKKWRDGAKIVLTGLKRGGEADGFTRAALGKTLKQFLTYWKKMVFTGKGAMPRLFEREEDLVEYVRNTRGAIGFVRGEAAPPGCKVVSRLSE